MGLRIIKAFHNLFFFLFFFSWGFYTRTAVCMCARDRERARRGGTGGGGVGGVLRPSRLLGSSRSSPAALPMPAQLSLRSLLCPLRGSEHPKEKENSPTLLPGSHCTPSSCAVSMMVQNTEDRFCRLGGQQRGHDGRSPGKCWSPKAWLKPGRFPLLLSSEQGEGN